jgi:D-alanyl-D-alanine carboxypeptidase
LSRLLQKLAVILTLVAMVAGCTTAMPPEAVLSVPAAPQKYASIVVDARTGKQLFEMNSTSPRYPASLTKMMTLYMLFEALTAGRVEKDAGIPVSAYAASRPPSKLGLRPGERIDVDTAIRALTVKSANDVAAAVGEYLSDSEEAFAAAMTARARQLGMRSSPPPATWRFWASRCAIASRNITTIFRPPTSCSAASWCAAITTCSAASPAWTASRPAT